MRAYRSVFVPAGGTLLWIVMMLIFPREGNIVAGTIFAILFWVSLAITVFWSVILAKQQKEIKARKAQRLKQKAFFK